MVHVNDFKCTCASHWVSTVLLFWAFWVWATIVSLSLSKIRSCGDSSFSISHVAVWVLPERLSAPERVREPEMLNVPDRLRAPESEKLPDWVVWVKSIVFSRPPVWVLPESTTKVSEVGTWVCGCMLQEARNKRRKIKSKNVFLFIIKRFN